MVAKKKDCLCSHYESILVHQDSARLVHQEVAPQRTVLGVRVNQVNKVGRPLLLALGWSLIFERRAVFETVLGCALGSRLWPLQCFFRDD